MRNGILLVIMIMLIALPGKVLAGVEGFARLSLVQGEVQVRDEDSGEWLPAGVNSPLEEGDSVWAPAGSRAEIQLRNGSYLRLEGRTILDLVDIENDQQRFHLASGRLYVKTGSRADDLQVDWGDASVLVERKTQLKVDLLVNGDEEVAILKGAASVESAGERTRVRSGETITLHDYRGADIAPLRPVDEWEQWNRKRDKQLAARKRGETYLPEELVIYEDELTRNGDWVVVEEYGYVWRPRVSVSIDWAPYRHGRWVWRGNDYVWITSEPWGWAPYHYGRWAMVPGRGWCWVPPSRGDVFWGPGYVAWVSTGTHVGWVPLAPRETYYGRRNYGRHSMVMHRDARVVNVTNVTYRNVTVNNAITVVQRDGFARGTGRHEPARENIFRQTSHLVQRPEIRPVGREARMPTVTPVVVQHKGPAVQRPPVKELRERYPLLRETRRDAQRGQAAPSPAPGSRSEQRGVVTPSAAPMPLPTAPRNGTQVEHGRERSAEGRKGKEPGVVASEQQGDTKAPRVTAPIPEVKQPEPRQAVQAVPQAEKAPEIVKGRERARGERSTAGSRRAWRVETKESQPPATKVEGRAEKQSQPETRQERRRRDDR
jgi:FecR protein